MYKYRQIKTGDVSVFERLIEPKVIERRRCNRDTPASPLRALGASPGNNIALSEGRDNGFTPNGGISLFRGVLYA